MKDLDNAVSALLRTSEELTVVFEAVLLPQSLEQSHGDAHVDLPEDLRIVAVVSHIDDRGGHQEGSVFICGSVADELSIQHIFPITNDFSISIAQRRRHTVELGALDLSPEIPVLDSLNAGTGFTLTINPARGLNLGPAGHTRSLTFFTRDVREVYAMTHECKELGRKHAFKRSSDETGFRWLIPYISRQDLPPMFGMFPQDLRLANRPLDTRLSLATAGTAGDDVADLQLIRFDWLRRRAREISRKGRRRLKIRLGTFNVNGKMPSQDLSNWIGGVMCATSFSTASVASSSSQEIAKEYYHPQELSDSDSGVVNIDVDPYPDLLVLGFQEVDLSTEALLYSMNTMREEVWYHALLAALGEKAEMYDKLVSKQLVGMLIIMIAKKTLIPHFNHVRTSAVGAGILGVMGNKGGAAIQVTFSPPPTLDPNSNNHEDAFDSGSTTLTFVNSHLAAFDEMFDRRNWDFQELSKKLQFTTNLLGETQVPLSLYESDALFWMFVREDLNYRIDLPDPDVREILALGDTSNELDILLERDQLRRAMSNRMAFEGFIEHHITHLPTYRFNHTLVTDGLGYDIKRKPAWTDRILYMTGPNVDLRQLTYTAHAQITMSDHRPVSADFVLDIDLFDQQLHDDSARELYQAADVFVTTHRPNLKLESTHVDFGLISYKRRFTETIQIQNSGKRSCVFRFVSVNFESQIYPKWLRIEPMQALLLPDAVITLTFTAYVDNDSASQLNLSSRELVVTLILRTIAGKDHFITVTATYQPTCFANPLSVLTRLPGPIRSVDPKRTEDLDDEKNSINAPREIMRLIKRLMTSTVDIDGLFTSPADESIVNVLRECLDTGDDFPFPAEKIERKIAIAFAATLLQFFKSLPESLIPPQLHPQCALVKSKDEAYELLDRFSSVEVNVWIALTAFLHYKCYSSSNWDVSAKAKRIASVLGSVLLRDDPQSALPPISPLAKRNFLLYFIS